MTSFPLVASPARRRVIVLVAALALAAAAATDAIVWLQTRGSETASAPAARTRPPLFVDLGVRGDREARDLRRAARLYNRGGARRAAELFARYDSVQARVGAAFAAWPDGTIERLEGIVREHPASGVARLNLGIALAASGRAAAARSEWRRAAALAPDSGTAVEAGDLLHPQFRIPGLPPFVAPLPDRPRPPGLSPARTLALLAREAARGGVTEKLRYGIALQQVPRPLSAEAQFAAAARLAPREPAARVAAAVGLFTKANPTRAFARLGPLSGEFPRAATVRFHLGLLLLWVGEAGKAERQLRLASADAPGSLYARYARLFLQKLSGANGG